MGITGASGSIYGFRLTQVLLTLDFEVEVCISKNGIEVARYETGLALKGGKKKIKEELISSFSLNPRRTDFFLEDELSAPAASGSNYYKAVFVAPCSMSSLSHIAYGTTENLIHRAAGIALKQGFPLILLPRETPVSLIHLKAMVSVAEAGARIVLPSPAFYFHPESIEDIIDFIVGKMLDVAKIENKLFKRWKN